MCVELLLGSKLPIHSWSTIRYSTFVDKSLRSAHSFSALSNGGKCTVREWHTFSNETNRIRSPEFTANWNGCISVCILVLTFLCSFDRFYSCSISCFFGHRQVSNAQPAARELLKMPQQVIIIYQNAMYSAFYGNRDSNQLSNENREACLEIGIEIHKIEPLVDLAVPVKTRPSKLWQPLPKLWCWKRKKKQTNKQAAQDQ